ncbi:MAG: hypothetical protein R2719_15285 [Micropruina sp.]
MRRTTRRGDQDRPLVSVRGGRVSVARGRVDHRRASTSTRGAAGAHRIVRQRQSRCCSTLTGRARAAGLTFRGRRTATISRVGFVPQRGLDALHPLIPLGRQLARVSRAAPGRVARVLDAVGLTDPGLRRRRPTGSREARRSVRGRAGGADRRPADPCRQADQRARSRVPRPDAAAAGQVITDDQALVVAATG